MTDGEWAEALFTLAQKHGLSSVSSRPPHVFLDKRLTALEAALRESETILTALAMAPEGNRKLVCSDEKLSAALRAARDCIR